MVSVELGQLAGMMLGAWGGGGELTEALTEAGCTYEEAQVVVNALQKLHKHWFEMHKRVVIERHKELF